MIIGGGMLAKAFAHRADDNRHIIFASGVSDSGETRRSEFLREEKLLRAVMRANPAQKLVYFSTCSIYDSTLQNSPYIGHKMYMEHLIRANRPEFIIFRLPQVVGSTQSPTIVHFLYEKIVNDESFDLWANGGRNLIDVADVARVVDYILHNQLFNNQIVNLAADKSHSIYEIVMVLEQLTQKRALYRVIEKGTFYHIDLSQVRDIYCALGVTFGTDYIAKTIGKYYTGSMSVPAKT